MSIEATKGKLIAIARREEDCFAHRRDEINYLRSNLAMSCGAAISDVEAIGVANKWYELHPGKDFVKDSLFSEIFPLIEIQNI